MLKVKKLEYQKSGIYGFLEFVKAKTIFFVLKTLGREIEEFKGYSYQKTARVNFQPFLSYNASKISATKIEKLRLYKYPHFF
jgi:hypothetical protein